jgi:hypothetical protein
VYGSNDKNAEFTDLGETFSKDDANNPLPTSADQLWTSSEIGNGTAYRYLRFNITKSGIAIKVDDNKDIDTSKGEQLSNKYNASLYAETPQVEYCFAMSEFALTNIVDEEQETEILAGTVTEQQLSDATDANEEAERFADESASGKDLIDKTKALQIIYDALYAAAFNVSLTPTDKERDLLLKGINHEMTIGTFSAPYATVIPDGVTAYYATQEYNGKGGTVWLTPITEPAIPAYQGVIIIGEVGKKTATFEPATTESLADLSDNVLANTAKGAIYAGESDYALAKGNDGIGIYKVKTGVRIKAGKAYFHLETTSAAQSFVLKFNGSPTDIEDALTNTDDTQQPIIYDLYGRRVKEVLKSGFYIVNGKKVFIK